MRRLSSLARPRARFDSSLARPRARFDLFLLAVLGCSSCEHNAATAPAREPAKAPATLGARGPQTRISDASPSLASPVSASAHAATIRSECAQSPLGRSRCMIETVLEEVKATYLHTGGGGISGVRRVAPDTYAVSIAQEERQDVITYALELDDRGQVVIRKRSESTLSRGP